MKKRSSYQLRWLHDGMAALRTALKIAELICGYNIWTLTNIPIPLLNWIHRMSLNWIIPFKIFIRIHLTACIEMDDCLHKNLKSCSGFYTSPAPPCSFHLSILRLYTFHFHNKFNFLNKNEQSRIRYIFLLFTLDFFIDIDFSIFCRNCGEYVLIHCSVLCVDSRFGGFHSVSDPWDR